MSETKPSANETYQRLYTSIIDGEFKPGTRLRESDLAEKFGLSRTPVREALRRLESAGLVVHEANKGAIVRQLDYQSANELYLMREVLEGTAAGLAALHISGPELEAAYDILAEEERVGDDDKEASRLNKIFHQAIYNGAHNRYLLEILDGLSVSMALLGQSTLAEEDRKSTALKEHRAILDAIGRRDQKEADALARAHIRAAHRIRLKMILTDE